MLKKNKLKLVKPDDGPVKWLFGGYVTCPCCDHKNLRILVFPDGTMALNHTDAQDPETWDGLCKVVDCRGIVIPRTYVPPSRRRPS